MTNTNQALELLRAANPVASVEALDPTEVAAVVVECGERVETERSGGAPGALRSPQRVVAPAKVRGILRPSAAFGVAFVVIFVAVVVAALVGRDAGSPADPVPDTTAVTSTTLTSTTATSPVVSTTVAVRTLGGVNIVDDLVYYSDGDTTLSMSVFYPSSGSGPWPVAVAYHTHCEGCSAATLARELAGRGAVVFAPDWVPSSETAEEYVDGMLFDRAACAVGAAHARAEEFGGDPRATTIIGQGGGEHPAAWVALGITRNRPCDEPVQYQPIGLVVGNPQFVFQQAFWDPAFADPTSNARDTIDRFLNVERWRTSDDLSVLSLATQYTGNSREVSLDGSDAWLADRDTTGTLVDDLAAVAAFDDEVILFEDNARLFDRRLRQAGVNSSVMVDERSTWEYTEAWYDAIETLMSTDP
ncbi:MAG: hypothetical protein ACR2N9_06485 [Acidimicrobiia bacterium]